MALYKAHKINMPKGDIMAQSKCVSYKLVKISPTMAQSWLDHNCGNRKLSNSMVTRLKNSIVNDKWEITHQGIAIDENGNLIDGQHRCNAIVQSGKSVECWVATYSGSTTAKEKPIDIGSKRSASCVTGIETPVCEVLLFISRLLNVHSKYQAKDLVETLYEICSPQQKELLQILSIKKLPAPVRAAFFIHCSCFAKKQSETLDVYDKVSVKGNNKYYGLSFKESVIMNIIDTSDYSTGRNEAFFKVLHALITDGTKSRLTENKRSEYKDLVVSMFARAFKK